MKTFSRILLLCLSAALLLLAGACHPTARRSTAALLDDVESYINDRPDSALAVLRGLDSTAVRGRALRARAALLHSMALDKCFIDLQTDSILAPAVAWYNRHGSADEKLKTQYYLGRIQYNAGDYQEAIVTYTEALSSTNKTKDIKYTGFANQAIADTYVATYQESEAFPYLDRAYEAFMQVPDSSLAKKTLYKKALSLTKQQKWEQADSFYCYLLNHLRGIEALESQIKADYALSLVQWNLDNAGKAAELFSEVIDSKGTLRSANLWAAYALCLSRIGEKESAESLFRQLSELYPTDKRVLFWRSLFKSDAERYKEALKDFKTVVSYQDSLLRIQLNHSTLAAQKEYFEHHALLARQAVRKKAQMLWAVIILSSVIVGVILLLFRKIIQKKQRDNARLEQLIETIKRQVANTNQEQTALKHQFNNLFQDYFNTLGKICADYEEGRLDTGSNPDRTILRRLDRIIWDFTGKGGDHEEFEALLNKHLDNIMKEFRIDFPDLSRKDYYLASYLFAGIDLPTISILMGMEVGNLYTRKSRLKSTIGKSNSANKTRYLAFFHR